MNQATLTEEQPQPQAVEPKPRANENLAPTDLFVPRHIGPSDDEIAQMLQTIGVSSLDELIDQTIPASIRLKKPLKLGPPRGENQTLEELRKIASKNKVYRSLVGMGYYDTITPPVIQRNILEHPGWYTQYTPYQAEIAQGRLEALLNFQTMVADLTALPLANASLLDEATAAAEAMAMCVSIHEGKRRKFIIADDCHPQTIAVVRTRARSMGIELRIADCRLPIADWADVAGLLVQYPATDGRIVDYSELVEQAHAAGALVVYATDLLALTLIKPPGEFGADIAVGSSQRFGVPLGFGGPHAAFMSTKTEYARKMPGRIVGVSKDVHGNVAYRLAIQTREQHIRRERATSNICTAQVLLAIMASMYAVYHGPEGLRRIARRVHLLTRVVAATLKYFGYDLAAVPFFDTVKVRLNGKVTADRVLEEATRLGVNLRKFDDSQVGFSIDETCTEANWLKITRAFCDAAGDDPNPGPLDYLAGAQAQGFWDVFPHKDEGTEAITAAFHNPETGGIPRELMRTSTYLTHAVFNTHHSETEMLRYITKLQSRDLALAHSMIPLGSCTMKLNATSEMLPVTWDEFSKLHPFAPADQTKGYQLLFKQLEKWIAEMTGLKAVSLQPNAGSQGEYAGLLAIRAYHESRGDVHRDVCLIPTSAHGTNPASAVIAGYKVVAVATEENGNIDVNDLRAKAKENEANLGALMITYPSTHGVFEESVKEICQIVHKHGGQVYMDGANLNAQLGLTNPGIIGADVCHLNLHKTFCIPHGGGGPGMGPIAVAKHLAPFLPTSPLPLLSPLPPGEAQGEGSVGPVSAAPYGSPSILTISWMYIAMMGAWGLKRASEVAILNANYMATRLESHYPVLYLGKNGRCAHEFILDARPFEKSAGIKVEDIAKRLIDYGFHAPTMSFPVPGTLMIEPTESEPKAELDRFCDAMIQIRQEIRDIEEGKGDRTDNVLKNSPHTIAAVSSDNWPHKYPRQQAAFPAPWLRDHKFWPFVGRIDNPYGDRNLFCTCPPVSSAGSEPSIERNPCI